MPRTAQTWFLQPLEGVDPVTLWFLMSTFQNSKKINFCSLNHLVCGTLQNSYRNTIKIALYTSSYDYQFLHKNSPYGLAVYI